MLRGSDLIQGAVGTENWLVVEDAERIVRALLLGDNHLVVRVVLQFMCPSKSRKKWLFLKEKATQHRASKV
jgi:hypothetical protein